MATFATSEQLLVIIDPAARQADGESVRIAKDVLSAGAATKVCLPDGPEEFARALSRRGSRRPVVVGDGRALVRAVTLLHRARELAGCALSVVPVGDTRLAESLGVPGGTVAAARAVLDGEARRLDLLVDDSDGVVLSGLGIPPEPVARAAAAQPVAVACRPWYRSLVRTLAPARPGSRPYPLPAPPGSGWRSTARRWWTWASRSRRCRWRRARAASRRWRCGRCRWARRRRRYWRPAAR